VSVVVLDVDIGLYIGLGVSILFVVIKDQLFQTRQLEKYKYSEYFVDADFIQCNVNKILLFFYFVFFLSTFHQLIYVFKTNKKADNLINRPLAFVKIIKLQRSLYFANCEAFKENLFKICQYSPYDKAETIKRNKINDKKKELVNSAVSTSTVMVTMTTRDDTFIEEVEDEFSAREQDIIIDMSAVNYIDTNAIKILVELVDIYKKIDVKLCFCGAQGSLVSFLFLFLFKFKFKFLGLFR
jgi:MFS superfamily sulfate permease-like transporter